MKHKFFNKFLSNNFLVLILINLGNLFAYLFQILLGSNLSVADYGEFNALNSLLIYVSPIAIIVPLIISRYTAIFDIRDSKKINGLINYVFKNLFILTFLILIILLLLFNFIYNNLNISSSINLYLTIFLISITVFALVPIGILQGRENFLKFSIISSSTNYVKFFLLLLLLYYNLINIHNVFIIIIIAVLSTFFAGLFFTRDYLKITNVSISSDEKNDLIKYIFPIFLSTIFVQTLIGSDIIFVRIFLDPESSGLYSMAAVLSKILYFLPASLIFVLFPRVVKENELNDNKNKSLMVSFALTFLIGFIAVIIIYFFKSEIIFFTFKQTDELVSDTFFYLSLCMFLFSLVNIIIASYSAKNNFKYLYIMFFGIIIYFLLFYINHENINSIIINMLTTSFIILIVFLIYYFIESKKISS